MKLSDIMGHMDLSHYAELGLILFLLAFTAITIRLFWFTPNKELSSAAMIPLNADDTPLNATKREDSTHA